MPTYNICYLTEDGALAGSFLAQAISDKHAKILAHAMRLPGSRGLEVWCEASLVYARPERIAPKTADVAPQNAVRDAA